MLRQFLYTDRELIREFLAQLEGGLYEESRERTSQSGSRGSNAKLGLGPAGASIERAKSVNAESEAIVKQTSASEFDRLYASLVADGLPVYDAIDEKLDALPIKRKEIVEVDARLSVSGLETMLDLVGTINRFMPLIEQFGGGTNDLDPKTTSGMQALSGLAAAEPALGNRHGARRVRSPDRA